MSNKRFVSLPIVGKDNKIEKYSINVDNVNYFRRWEQGEQGKEQTVLYFKSDKKYLIVDLSIDNVMKVFG